jgi:hypothetical protein
LNEIADSLMTSTFLVPSSELSFKKTFAIRQQAILPCIKDYDVNAEI